MKKIFVKKGKISEVINDIQNKRWRQDKCFIEHLKKDKKELENRINIAIEYINKHFEDDEDIICKITGKMVCEVNYNFLEDLLNILQNGSDDKC